MFDDKNPLVGLSEMETYTEEAKKYINDKIILGISEETEFEPLDTDTEG